MKCPICNADNFDGECKECSYTVGENCKTFANMIMVGTELERGYYYTREPCEEDVKITHSHWINQFGYEALKMQIYAKVPSYDEYKDMLEEIIKLKKLLKECYDILYKAGFLFKKVADIDKVCNIRQRIQEVLGEEYGFKKVTYHIRKREKDLGEE